jgi:polyphosphate kinase
MKLIVIIIFLFYFQNLYCQNVENVVADSTCKCLNKIDTSKLQTKEQKAEVIKKCLQQASNENEQLIKADQNTPANKNYSTGHDYGYTLGKKITPILTKKCEVFKKLLGEINEK